jgi:Amt family ammonium transporter
LLFVYFPIAHMVWGGGLFASWGALDFAGGTAVHASSGFAALASVLFVGKRKFVDKGPHSIPLVALGTGLLWFGWYGFNAGSEMKIDSVTTLAFANTDIAASVAAILSLTVANRPAANKMGLDDALDLWGVHGIGGVLGCLLTGVFATKLWNANGADGLLLGGTHFFAVEAVSVLITAAYAFLFTYGALWLINLVTQVKVSQEEEEEGLDVSVHGEEAYIVHD